MNAARRREQARDLASEIVLERAITLEEQAREERTAGRKQEALTLLKTAEDLRRQARHLLTQRRRGEAMRSQRAERDARRAMDTLTAELAPPPPPAPPVELTPVERLQKDDQYWEDFFANR